VAVGQYEDEGDGGSTTIDSVLRSRRRAMSARTPSDWKGGPGVAGNDDPLTWSGSIARAGVGACGFQVIF
jgi:hypothetical protein